MNNIGFRVYKKVNRPPRDLIEKFRDIPVAVLGDVMNRVVCMDAKIQPVNSVRLVGPAVTVHARPGDNLLMHYSLDLAEPGDVIVVDGRGDMANSLAGENMANWSLRHGHAGWVVDGALRDVEALREMKMAFYCAGIQPNGPYKQGPGEINTPIQCGGVAVNPGDIIVGDADGVVVVPAHEAEQILERAYAKQKQEADTAHAINDGTWDRKSYSDSALTAKGCTIVDDVYR